MKPRSLPAVQEVEEEVESTFSPLESTPPGSPFCEDEELWSTDNLTQFDETDEEEISGTEITDEEQESWDELMLLGRLLDEDFEAERLRSDEADFEALRLAMLKHNELKAVVAAPVVYSPVVTSPLSSPPPSKRKKFNEERYDSHK